jgi:hypothetical protein
MPARGILRRASALLLLLALARSPVPGNCRPLQAAQPALDPDQWTARIHAGWVGKVAAGSGTLATEMWPKERIQQTYGVLNAPPKTLGVNCNDYPASVDWLLRVGIGDQVWESPIRWIEGQPQWQDFTFDLKPWAGQRVTIILENAVLGKQAWEAGFWTAPQLLDAQGRPLHGQPPAGRPYRYPLAFAPKILPETFSVLVGLWYGAGDFRRSVSLTTMCGFDTDCNAGTVGCLLGLRNGLDGIAGEWKDPLNDTYELQVTGLPRQWKIAELAAETAQTGLALALGK